MRSEMKGSLEWFEWARKDCIRHALALAHINLSRIFILKLSDEFENNDAIINFSLFRSYIIEYSKPFVQGRTASPYPIKLLKNESGFSVETHEEIILLRNKLLAHQDSDYTDSTVGTVLITIGRGNISSQHAMASHCESMFLVGIAEKVKLERFIFHVDACINAIIKQCDDALEAYTMAADEFQDVYFKHMENPRFTFKSEKMEMTGNSLSFATRKIGLHLEAPNLKNRDGFLYAVTSVSKTRSTPIKFTDENGNADEMNISHNF